VGMLYAQDNTTVYSSSLGLITQRFCHDSYEMDVIAKMRC